MATANTHTRSHTLTRACTSTHPSTHTHTRFGGKEGGFDRHTFYKTKITTLIENKKMERKKEEAVIALRTLDIEIHSINFKKCAKFTKNFFF